MNALQLVALADATDKLAKKADKLTVGVHNVNMTCVVRLTGTVTKLADTNKVPTVSIPLKATLALCLQKAGFQRENIAAILTECMTEALNLNEQAEAGIKATLADVDAAMEHVQSITAALPRTPVRGATKCKLTCEIEQVEPVETGLADKDMVEAFLDRLGIYEG